MSGAGLGVGVDVASMVICDVIDVRSLTLSLLVFFCLSLFFHRKMEGLAKQLTNTLIALKKESARNMVQLSSIRDGSNTVSTLRDLKRAQGLVIVREAFTLAALSAATLAARAAWWTDVAPQLKPEDLPAQDTPLSALPWPTGIVGNASFGYLFAQPEAVTTMPVITLSSGARIAVAPGSGYKANIELISHPDSQLAMALVYAISGNRSGVISQDSCKIHRGVLTQPHVDIYEDSEQRINRMQAMGIGAGEGSIRLCYLRFSNNPDVKRLITDLLEMDIYGTRGFQTVPKEGGKDKVLLKCFEDARCIQYGSPGDLVMWEPGVIHLEMKLLENGSLVPRADNTTTTERYIVGTHTPMGLGPRELTEVAFVAENGFFFHPYNNANRGTAAGVNSVHKKRTQFKRPRVRSEDERERFEAVQRRILETDPVDAAIASMSGRKRHCLGVSQNAEDMYDDLDARRVHGE